MHNQKNKKPFYNISLISNQNINETIGNQKTSNLELNQSTINSMNIYEFPNINKKFNSFITNNGVFIDQTNNNKMNINNNPKKCQKRLFTIEEDEQLISLVNKYGENNWNKISEMMKKMNFNRNCRQCRDRYFHYLNPNITNDSNWSSEEDNLLLKSVEQFGKKWKYFEKIFPKRSEVSLRNRYRLLERKKFKGNDNKVRRKGIMSDSFSFLDKIGKYSSTNQNNMKINVKCNSKNNIHNQFNENQKKLPNKNYIEGFNNSNIFSFMDEDVINFIFS